MLLFSLAFAVFWLGHAAICHAILRGTFRRPWLWALPMGALMFGGLGWSASLANRRAPVPGVRPSFGPTRRAA